MATKADKSSFSGQQPRLNPGIQERALSALVLVGVTAAVVLGWLYRNDDFIDPEHGLGYALGIIGGSMMIILLAYPIRKRAKRRLRAAGSVGFWFRFHMLFGLLGPLAILYHSRFSWGSLNSTVALAAMIIVTCSGLVGRFLYSRVHRGYSGRKLELRTLKQEMDGLLSEFETIGVAHAEVLGDLHSFEERAVAAGRDFWTSAGAVLGLGFETRRAERRLARVLPARDEGAGTDLRGRLAHFFQAVRRAAEFAFYDRLLRLWHLLHLPLFFLLVATAILHIVAVHQY